MKSEKPIDQEMIRRIRQDLLDGYDEELEMEDEDLTEMSAPGQEKRVIADRAYRRQYFRELFRLQAELVKMQDWIVHTGYRMVILFEGRDAAGKGGTIKRFMEHLNPRGARVVALEKPSERERTQWYFQRYIQNLPAGGEIVFFDRSWYNRAGVERVMNFCTPNEYLDFMRQCPELERMFVGSGMRLFKYWFSVTRDEQTRRFKARKKFLRQTRIGIFKSRRLR